MKTDASKNCSFCKIIKGELSAYKVYEDDLCMAFLPLRAINPGHLILCPKEHVEDYHLLSDEITAHLAIKAKALSKAVMRGFSSAKVGYAVAGFEVLHAHMHIIPLHKMHEITSSAYVSIVDGKIEFLSENLIEASDEEKKDIVEKLKGVK